VENPEGGGEFLKVAPRRRDCPVPFEMARVLLPGLDQVVAFQVYTSGTDYVDDEASGAEGESTLLSSFRLDENAKYFLVLLAMCEPRLRDESSVAVPSVPAVVRRLRDLPSCADITPAAVTFHIDYLARIKLRLRDGEAARRGESRGASLVGTALRFNLIREEHLVHLPPRTR